MRFELLHIPVFDVLHQPTAVQQILVHARRKLARNDRELIVNGLVFRRENVNPRSNLQMSVRTLSVSGRDHNRGQSSRRTIRERLRRRPFEPSHRASRPSGTLTPRLCSPKSRHLKISPGAINPNRILGGPHVPLRPARVPTVAIRKPSSFIREFPSKFTSPAGTRTPCGKVPAGSRIRSLNLMSPLASTASYPSFISFNLYCGRRVFSRGVLPRYCQSACERLSRKFYVSPAVFFPALQRLISRQDRDIAAEFLIARAIHFSHTARAERRLDFVGSEARAECQRQARMEV
jgi:hypothetical protein